MQTMISMANRLILFLISTHLTGFLPVFSQMLPEHDLIQTETSVTEAYERLIRLFN